MHATAEEAREETQRMLNVYADFLENTLAMPVVKGQKTEKEKFNGAEETYTVECMMHDHKALQSGTSHYFGDGFARAFDTRMIGGIIMTHGDNNGLVLPPRIAPIQAMVIPVAQHKEGVLDAATALLERLQAAGIRAKMDASDQSMGWKAAEYEMKGVPLRIELGPKDMEKNQCVLVRRDSGEKVFISLEELETAVPAMLDSIHDGLYQRAKKNLEEHIFPAHSLEEAKKVQEEHGGFVKTMWCGELDCEMKMKEEAGMTSRCIPFAQEHLGDTCPICGRAAKKMIYWGVAY